MRYRLEAGNLLRPSPKRTIIDCMVILGVVAACIAAAVGLAVAVWQFFSWLDKRFKRLNRKLDKHDAADRKLKARVKAVERKVDDGFAEIKEMIERQAA